jgi:hypothetical protein
MNEISKTVAGRSINSYNFEKNISNPSSQVAARLLIHQNVQSAAVPGVPARLNAWTKRGSDSSGVRRAAGKVV